MSSPKAFYSTSTPTPTLLNVSFQDDPKGSLGVTLVNTDKTSSSSGGGDAFMFLPAYAVVGKLLEGDDTVARRAGVKVGDQLVAVNGQGFRRFKPDYNLDETQQIGDSSVVVALDHAVAEPGHGYDNLLKTIKETKAGEAPESLVLSLERYCWDERPNSWQRFLTARDDNVIEAMGMIQTHEQWKQTTFPIDLLRPGLQRILRAKAVSEIDVEAATSKEVPPTVYVHYSKLLDMQTAGEVTVEDIVDAFIIFTERMLAKAADPRQPKTCQMIDLTGVSITSGFRVEALKKIYTTFEPK